MIDETKTAPYNLGKTCDEYKERIDELETMILVGNYLEGVNFDEVQDDLQEC